MSSIGPSNQAALNLAGSFAGAQRSTAQQDETKTQQAAQKFQVDQSETADLDVAETDMDADRDADGRYGSAGSAEQENREDALPSSEESSTGGTLAHAPDAFGERGTQLDLDA